MLGSEGDPTAGNLLGVLSALRADAGVHLDIRIAS